MKKTSILLIIIAFFGACNTSPEAESESLKEARETYKSMMDILEDGADIAQKKLEKMGVQADSLLAEGDSLLAQKMKKMNTKLDSLHKELEDLKHEAEEMRAHSALMQEGEEHEHHHHHGGGTVDYNAFSDEQLLDLQREMKSQVEELKKKIDRIQIAITDHADTTKTQP